MTNHFESFWSRIKRHLHAVNGSQGDMTIRHVTEAVYRQNYFMFDIAPFAVDLDVGKDA